MAGICVLRTEIGVRLRVSPERLRITLGDNAATAGQLLAQHVDRIVREQQLGYYPAMGYFDEAPDPALLGFIHNAERWAREYVGREVRNRLWPVFSTVQIRSIVPLVYTLPPIRPRDAEALVRLGQHYTPGGYVLDLMLTSLERDSNMPTPEKLAGRKVRWWLRESFETVDITDCRLVVRP